MKLKLIFIIAILTNWLYGTTLYEDGNSASDWVVSDNRPSGATISSVADNGENVIECNGHGKKNAYLLGDKRASSKSWDNSDDKNITWSMKFNESFRISVYIKTTNGSRVLYYDNKSSKGKRRNKIHHGLGSQSSNGEWQTVSRDLEADLQEFESNNELEMVYGFEVRGSGMVDNITLISDSQSNQAPVATPQNVTTNEDTTTDITLSGNDADGDALTYTIVTQPTHGTLSGTAPNLTYNPEANYFGADSFTFKVNDGTVDSYEATVNITINSVNDTPILSKNNLTVSFDEHNVSRVNHPVKAESVDLDSDGDVDIVSATWGSNGSLSWYENDGSQNFVEHNISTSAYGNNSYGIWSIKSIDFDNDGDIDIVASNISGDSYENNTSIRWYENDGSQNFIEHNISSTLFAMGVDAKDIDEDGDIDIVASKWWGGENNNSIVWLENDGNQNFTEHTVIENYLGLTGSINAVDIDRDGDIDLLPAKFWGSSNFSWYENDGSQNFTEHNISTNTGNDRYSYSAKAIDLDKDGDMDILTTFFDNNNNGTVTWYENDGSQNFTEHNISQVSDDVMSNGIDIQAIDIDNDGDIDVIQGHYWYENDGNQGFTTHNISSAFTAYFTLSDIDGDGDIDIALPYWTDSLIVWQENLGLTTIYVKENNATVGTITATDVDGDSLTYSISGDDADKFDINASTGVLTFKNLPDYENPTDEDEDNIYEINVAVTDGSESDNLDIRVIVENDTTDDGEE